MVSLLLWYKCGCWFILSRCQVSIVCHRESRDAPGLDIFHPPGLQVHNTVLILVNTLITGLWWVTLFRTLAGSLKLSQPMVVRTQGRWDSSYHWPLIGHLEPLIGWYWYLESLKMSEWGEIFVQPQQGHGESLSLSQWIKQAGENHRQGL